MTNSTHLVVGWAIVLFAIVWDFGWFALFLSRWRMYDQRIMVRNPWIKVVTCVAIFVDQLSLGMYLIWRNGDSEKFVLDVLMIHDSLMLTFVLGLYLLKTFELYFRFNLADEIIRFHGTSHLKEVESTSVVENQHLWFIRNQYLLSSKVQLPLFLIWFAFCFVVSGLGTLTYARKIADSVLVLVAAVLLIALLWRIRGKKDVWGMKMELMLVVFLSIAASGIFLFSGLIENKDPNLVALGAAVVAFCFQWIFFEAVGRPCIQTCFRGQSKVAASRGSSMYKPEDFRLKKLLKIPDFIPEFQAFLAKSFTAEHLTFIQAVERFEDELNGNSKTASEDSKPSTTIDLLVEEFFREASQIMRVYINNKGAIPINISAVSRDKALSSFEAIRKLKSEKNYEDALNGLKNLFTAGKQEVFYILENDALPRYMLTPEFKQFKEMNVKVDVIVNNSIPEPIRRASAQPSLKALMLKSPEGVTALPGSFEP